jgi:MFS family permease
MNNFLKLFRNKNFSFLWTGQFVSGLGDRFTQMALLTIAMILYADTGEKMAWITFYSLLPFLIFGQVFSVIGDRLSRKKIMIIADILRAILVISIPFINRFSHPMGYIYFIIFSVGTLSALFSPAKMALIPNLVEKEKVVNANSLMASSGMIATILGTLIAGYLIKFFGPYPMFFMNAFTFFISAVMIANIPAQSLRQRGAIPSVSVSSTLKGIKDGFSFINRHQLILRIVQLNAVFSLISAFFYITILNYSITQLKLFSQGYGILLASIGLGLCLGAVLLGRRIGKLNYNSLLFMGFGTISLASVLMMFRPDFKFSVLILILAGACASLVMITLDSLLQRATPDSLRAKVFGARSIATNFVFLLSLIIVGNALSKFNYFHIFGFIWIVSFITTIVIYVSERQGKELITETMENDGLLEVDPNVIVRHIINFE